MANLDLSFIIKLSILSTLAFFGLVASQNSTEQEYPYESDLVKSLPGYTGNYSERGHYSGYLEADNRTFLHYMFFKSQTGNWSTDPVLMWIAGGPGDSSVALGVSQFSSISLSENGSLKLEDEFTNYSILHKANALFIDSPAGVGFSYQLEPQDKEINDVQTADYNNAAIKNFFFKFPHLQNNSFYITGGSYASYYIALLGARLVKDKFLPNFKGVLIQSASFNGSQVNAATLEYGYQLGLIDQSHWARYIQSCCPATFCSTRECFFERNCFFSEPPPFCCHVFKILWMRSFYNIHNAVDNSEGNSEEQMMLTESNRFFWFNKKSVKRALNIRNIPITIWQTYTYKVPDGTYISVLNEVRLLLENGIRMTLYYGDSDLRTSYINALWLFDDLGDQLKTVQPNRPWIFEDEMIGYQRRLVYTNQANTSKTDVTLFVVRNAGHLVTNDYPARFYKVYSDFIDGV